MMLCLSQLLQLPLKSLSAGDMEEDVKLLISQLKKHSVDHAELSCKSAVIMQLRSQVGVDDKCGPREAVLQERGDHAAEESGRCG